jgi:CHAT domain-containing protein/tetratricopeptide (TPR) repeat protein
MSDTCPSGAALLLFALPDTSGSAAEVARHVAGCPDCRAAVVKIRTIAEALDAAATRAANDGSVCFDEAAIALVAEGTRDALTAIRVAHLAACGRCRGQLAALVHLLAAPEVATEVRLTSARPATTRRPSTREWLAAAGLLATAAVLLLAILPRGFGDRIGAHRGPTITAATAPTLAFPLGDVDSARTLHWTAVAGVNRYRLILFNAAGVALLDTQTTDTAVAIPDSVAVLPGELYLWKVEARSGFDRWVSSDLVEFRVRPDSENGVSSMRGAPHARFGAVATAAQGTDSLRLRILLLSDAALVREARERPLELREALAATLALAVRGSEAARARELATARRLAAAHAAAWQDPFLIREVERFAGWSPQRRAVKVAADSVRRAGIVAWGRDGAAAAIAIWRGAERRASSIGDSAGLAATLGNIGAGFAREGSLDSAVWCLDRAQRIAAAIGDHRVTANALSELAGVREVRGDYAGAYARYREAIALRSRVGDTRGLASDYNNLGGLAQAAGDVDQASRYFDAALSINRRDRRPDVAATNLVNLAGLAALHGELARAESYYREAIEAWSAAGREADLADAERGLGELELRRGDYPSARRHLLLALAIYERTGPLADALDVRWRISSARAAQGDLQGAVDELGTAQRLADSIQSAPNVRARIVLARADLATQLSMRPQAERLYANAQQLFRSVRDRAGEAEAQQGRAALLLDLDDPSGAKALLDASIRTQLSLGDRRAASLARLLLGEVALRLRDTTTARRELARAAAELARIGDPVAAAAALGEQAALEASAMMPAAAESLYRSALEVVGRRGAPAVSWRLHAGLGAVRRAQGATEEAAREFRAAIADIERSGHSLARPERRSTFFTDKWDVYVQLAMVEGSRGRTSDAFAVSERLRASEMLGLLALGRVAVPPDTSASLTSREQDLRRRVAELTREVEGSEGPARERGLHISSSGPAAREALLAAQESYGELQLQMRERAPRHAALVAQTAISWHEVARHLARDEALIEYLLSDHGSTAFVITKDTVTGIALPVARGDVAQRVDFVRGTLEPRGSPRVGSLWRAPLRQLHADLISPIESSGILRGVKRLTVVPHVELHYLPFGALIGGDDRERFLIERYELMVAPSASVWLALSARAPVRRSSGMIAFAPRPDALPASLREVHAVERFGGSRARVLVGRAATERAFRRDAPNRRVVHMATYGVLNKQNPLFSFVELSAEGQDDGRLEAHEVFGTTLSADLVVLSACQTGLASGAVSDVPAGDDWVGLVRAFLTAGARQVLATLWPVEDRATAVLMERFYKRYAADGDARHALTMAQRSMLASPGTAGPYYWAGFQLAGGQ